MNRTEAVTFARDLWPLFKTMPRNEWRQHFASVARSKGESEQWISHALAWIEPAFNFGMKHGI